MFTELLLIDIETVPITENFLNLLPEWQQLWCNKVAKIFPESVSPEESYRQRAGILSEFGKIICISTAFFYENNNKQLCLRIKSIYGDDEPEILKSFVTLCDKVYHQNKKFLFAGHNIKEFDIPYICRRLLINRLPLPEYLQLHDKKPWEVKMFDTLNWWRFGDNKNYVSLDLLANVLGVPSSKTDIDGSMVQDVYYKEKDLQRIVDYCQRDVVVVANVILRFKNQPLLKEENVVVVKG